LVLSCFAVFTTIWRHQGSTELREGEMIYFQKHFKALRYFFEFNSKSH
jgi:hypothetical protein